MATQTETRRVPFTTLQKKILLALASAVGLRMLGLFLVLPVFTLYALQFTRSRFLAGLAFGSYGLTNAFLQIPLARLSDHIGRRKVLMLGMSVFGLGSFVGAIPSWFPPGARIGVLVLARLLQGAGVTVSVAFATVADHIQSERRSTAMAILGIPIGAAFIIGIVGGPILAGQLGTASLFWLTALLSLGTVALIAHSLPETPPSRERPAPLGTLLSNRSLLALDGGGFLMNFFMTSFFFYFPLIVTGQHHISMSHYYAVLLPMILISGVTMFAFTRGADHGWARALSSVAFLTFLPSAVMLFRPALLGFDPRRLAAVLAGGTLFYIGFTGLEPILPSLVSHSAPESAYGTALGVYNSSQFMGSFLGASVAGALAHRPPDDMLLTLMAASLVGFVLMLKMRRKNEV